jgi:hypothetical protein
MIEYSPEQICDYCNKKKIDCETIEEDITWSNHHITGLWTKYKKTVKIKRCMYCKKVHSDAAKMSLTFFLLKHIFSNQISKYTLFSLVLFFIVYIYWITNSLFALFLISTLVLFLLIAVYLLFDFLFFYGKRDSFCKTKGTRTFESYISDITPKNKYFRI